MVQNYLKGIRELHVKKGVGFCWQCRCFRVTVRMTSAHKYWPVEIGSLGRCVAKRNFPKHGNLLSCDRFLRAICGDCNHFQRMEGSILGGVCNRLPRSQDISSITQVCFHLEILDVEPPKKMRVVRFSDRRKNAARKK
jgi:hypothetical protein